MCRCLLSQRFAALSWRCCWRAGCSRSVMPSDGQRLRVVIPLGITQTIAWASSYYLPAILARPIADDLGVPASYVYGALTGALIVAGLLGPRVGRAIARFG